MKKYYYVRTEDGLKILVECDKGFDVGEENAENWVRNRYFTRSSDEITENNVQRICFDEVWKVNDKRTYDIVTGNYVWQNW